MFKFLSLFELQLQALRSPDGSQAFPGKTCKDLKSCFDDLRSGRFRLFSYARDLSIGKRIL